MSVNKYDIFLGQVNQEELYFNDSGLIREVDISKINQYAEFWQKSLEYVN